MVEIILLIIAVIFALGVGFLIPVLIELRKTVREAGVFMKTTGESLQATLKETEGTMRNLHEITSDVNDVTKELRAFSGAITEVAENVRGIGELIESTVSETSHRVTGIKAGIMAASSVLIKNLFKKGG